MAPQGLHENQEESVVLDGDMAKSYNIVEIFHSVQGEGYRSGIPHVFIRFGVCNLRCEWCEETKNSKVFAKQVFPQPS